MAVTGRLIVRLRFGGEMDRRINKHTDARRGVRAGLDVSSFHAR